MARQHGIELATLLQTLVGAAVHGSLRQLRGINGGAERGDGLIAISVHQGVNRAEHPVQSVAGLTAQMVALFLDRIAGMPGHLSQE